MSDFREFLLVNKLECITVYIDTASLILFAKVLFKMSNVVAVVHIRPLALSIERQTRNIYNVQTVDRARFWKNVSMHPFNMPNVMVRRRCHSADDHHSQQPIPSLSSHVDVDSSVMTIQFRHSDMDSAYLFSKALRYGQWVKLSRYKCIIETKSFLLHLDNDDVVTQYAFCTHELDAHANIRCWIVANAPDLAVAAVSIAHVNEQFVSRQRNLIQQNIIICRKVSNEKDDMSYVDQCESALRQSENYSHLLVRYVNLLDGVFKRHFVNKQTQKELTKRIERSMVILIEKRTTLLTQHDIDLDEFTLSMCNRPVSAMLG
jgi:hypothetical protein